LLHAGRGQALAAARREQRPVGGLVAQLPVEMVRSQEEVCRSDREGLVAEIDGVVALMPSVAVEDLVGVEHRQSARAQPRGDCERGERAGLGVHVPAQLVIDVVVDVR